MRQIFQGWPTESSLYMCLYFSIDASQMLEKICPTTYGKNFKVLVERYCGGTLQKNCSSKNLLLVRTTGFFLII